MRIHGALEWNSGAKTALGNAPQEAAKHGEQCCISDHIGHFLNFTGSPRQSVKSCYLVRQWHYRCRGRGGVILPRVGLGLGEN